MRAVAVVRWTPQGSTLQSSQATWDAAARRLAETGPYLAAAALAAAIRHAEGPAHARRIVVPADHATLIYRAAEAAGREGGEA
jgi:hypothetical protein